MKKVLALVLAVMMLATVAFAVVENPEAGGTTYTAKKRPGDTLTITDSGIVTAAKDTYVLAKDKKADDGLIAVKNLNSTNYSISNIKYVDGKNLLDGTPKFNDAKDQLEIKLKNDYNNTKESNLEITFTLKGKKVGKGEKPENIDVKISYTVGYHLVKNAITLDSGAAKLTKDVDYTNKQEIYEVAGPDNYGTLEFTAEDGDTDVEVRVYDGDKLYLYNNVDAERVFLIMYADYDADITFLNFPGKPTFNATATVRFYKEESTYIYELKDGNLTAITAEAASAGAAGQTAGKVKWDEDEGCYILKTRTLGNYVFSDVALPLDVANNTTDTPVTNPDTGANDVVGIATALAAVALVSAAAVSLKK